MAGTTSLMSVGRITSALPSGKVLGCSNPSSPHESSVIITGDRQPDNLQSFYFCCKTSDKTTGVLATYDLKYILKVSTKTDSQGNRIVQYVKSPEPLLVNGAPFPSWATSEMMFHEERETSDRFWFISMIQRDSKQLVMDVCQNNDVEGNLIIVFPKKDSSYSNQLFMLEKPLPGSGASSSASKK